MASLGEAQKTYFFNEKPYNLIKQFRNTQKVPTRLCYMTTEDDLLPFQLHAGYVMFWALTCFLMKWDHMGSMFGGPSEACAQKEYQEQSATTGVLHRGPPQGSLGNPRKPWILGDFLILLWYFREFGKILRFLVKITVIFELLQQK